MSHRAQRIELDVGMAPNRYNNHNQDIPTGKQQHPTPSPSPFPSPLGSHSSSEVLRRLSRSPSEALPRPSRSPSGALRRRSLSLALPPPPPLFPLPPLSSSKWEGVEGWESGRLGEWEGGRMGEWEELSRPPGLSSTKHSQDPKKPKKQNFA